MSKTVCLSPKSQLVGRASSCSIRSDLVKILRETQGRLTILKGRTVNTIDDSWTCTTITAIFWSDMMKYMLLAYFEVHVRYIS